MGNKNKLGLPGGPNEIIVDSRGQWDNPGKNTRIPGNNITMKDVAYPVWAQPNVGPGTMMMPGSEHHFKNAEYVDEYPMMQEGGGVNEEGVEQYKWFKNYLQSPKYVERLKKEFPDYTDKQIQEEVKSRLENIMQTRVGFLPRSSKYSEGVGDTQGFYGSEDFPNTMMLRPEYSANTPDDIFKLGNYLNPFKTIPLHEWSHVADNVGNRIPQSTKDFMLSKMKENILGRPKDEYYFTMPTEYLGRMQPLRYLMKQEGLYDAGKQDFTKEDLEKAKQNKTIKNNTHFQDLMKNVKSDEDFIELMNNVASADNMESSANIGYAQDGGSTSWNWKGKSYSGTLIPSMETKKNRYARTKNGKIKTLPKAQYGLNGKFSLPTRDGVRLNYDNQGNVIGESSHIMKAEIFEGKWYAFPTLFQNEDKSWNSTFEKMLQVDEKNWMPAFEEAKRRGELIEFGDDQEGAIKFGEGSWKPANLPEYQIKGEVMKPTFPFATAPTGDEQIQFLLDWTNSPRGQALMSESLDGNQKDIEKLTFKRTDNLDTVRIGMNDVDGALGKYKPKGHTIAINQNLRDGKDKLIGNTEEDVLLHELSHSQDYSPNAEFNRNTMPFSDQKLINRLTKRTIKETKNLDESKKVRKDIKNRVNYIGDPTETRARLNSIRYFYENNPIGKEKGMPSIFDSEVTPEMMEIMKDNTQFRELKEVYDDEEILDLLNTISYQDSDIDSSVYAKFGIELNQKAAGGPGPGLIQILKQLKKLKNKGTKYFENLFGSTDNVAKAVVPATKQKGLYHMLPINKIDSPTHYGTVNIDDGTVQNALDIMKAQGKYTDDIGYSIEDLVGENVQYLGNQAGRTIVNVPLPNGKSQMFYKSTDLAGKGTEGFWQPYAGHAKVLDFPSKSGTIKNDNWFIKDGGYKNFYDSKSFRDIAGNLDRIAAEQGWDMSQQILKSQLKFGGDLPQAQKGKAILTQARKYLDNIFNPAVKQVVKQVDEVQPFTRKELIQDGWLPAKAVDNAWAVKPLPGLHLKSTMDNGAISKIIEPNTGLINTEQALAIINKESGGAAKVALIRKQLGDNIPKKMDYNNFRTKTQESLIPLEVKINPNGSSDYGLNNIGYNANQSNHGALTISNRNKFGPGSSEHGNPDDTLGHVHFLKDADNPNTLTITQIQSDAFQGNRRAKQTKEQLQRSLVSGEKHLEAQRKLHASAVQQPDGNWLYPDGMLVPDSMHKQGAKGQELYNAMSKAEIQNYSQKQLLGKNHEERYLQEIVNYAGANGNNKIRIPTMETAAKVQGFEDMQKNMDILKKYKNQPKTIKKLYGQDAIIVTDAKGNTWYEFDIPESFKSGKGEIKAFKQGGESKPYKIYKNYVMGNTSDKNSEKIYDKLNRIHYREAKQAGMDVPNYIMTYLSGNS